MFSPPALLPPAVPPLRGLVVLLALIAAAPASAAREKKPAPEAAAQGAAQGMLMPDLSKVLGAGWTIPPELSDRSAPGVVLEVTPTGYKTVMPACVAAAPRQSTVTDVSLSNSLSGGVGWGGGGLGASASASSALKLNFNGPTIHAYDLVDFVPSDDCVGKLRALTARGGDPSRWVVVQEALMARVSGCEQKSASAGVSAPGAGASASVSGACQMFSDAPVAVGLKTVTLAEIPELAGLVSSLPPRPTPEAAPAPAPASAPVVAPAPVVAAAVAEAAPTVSAGSRLVGKAGYPLRRVPAGTTLVGCTPGQGGDCDDDEKPARKVTLSSALWVGETELTQGLYQRLMGRNPSTFAGCGASCPVDTLSWFDAVAVANALSAAEGLEACYTLRGETVSWPKGLSCKGYRLPTEAEWEVAARGGADPKYAGGEALDALGWFIENSDGQTHPVAKKRANGFGLHDLSGNVWEWTWDAYEPALRVGAPDPSGPVNGGYRVGRGGSWSYIGRVGRVSDRFYGPPTTRDFTTGVRLVRSAD